MDEAWREFDQALERPAAEVAGLREPLSEPTVLDGPDRRVVGYYALAAGSVAPART